MPKPEAKTGKSLVCLGENRSRWYLGSGLQLRILLLNILLVFLPVAAMLFLQTYESQLLRSLEDAMHHQAGILAAALGTLEPDLSTRAYSGTADPIEPSAAENPSPLKTLGQAVLSRYSQQGSSRIRILDSQGQVLADSTRRVSPESGLESPQTLAGTREGGSPGGPDSVSPFDSFLYGLGSLPFRVWRFLFAPPEADTPDAEPSLVSMSAVHSALAGRPGASTRISPGQRSVTLYVAHPIAGSETSTGPGPGGVVVLSQSSWRILQDMYAIRLNLFQIFLGSLLAAGLISLILTRTISRPLKQLEAQARSLVNPQGRMVGAFAGVRGPREIQILSEALQEQYRRLAEYHGFMEGFARDLAHEARNPLAGIRSAAELLEQQKDRQLELVAMISHECRRLERVLLEARELGWLESRMRQEEGQVPDLAAFLETYRRQWELRGQDLDCHPARSGESEHPGDFWSGDLDSGAQAGITANPIGSKPTGLSVPVVRVDIPPALLSQALDKVVENARDFAPGTVFLEWGVLVRGQSPGTGLSGNPRQIHIDLRDSGPGIDPLVGEAVFQRFYSSRKDQAHSGLGLALARTIARGRGGDLVLLPHGGRGAWFRLTLPGDRA